MSTADKRKRESFPPEWKRLERSAEEAGMLLARWMARAREAEEEAQRLRLSLEELMGERPARADTAPEDADEQLRRLKAENAALHSRMLQARKRIVALMQRLAALDVEP